MLSTISPATRLARALEGLYAKDLRTLNRARQQVSAFTFHPDARLRRWAMMAARQHRIPLSGAPGNLSETIG